MKEFRGKVAAITGAGSGIGRALAIELANRGAKLALSDVDDSGLIETVAQVRAIGATVSSSSVDVADRQAVYSWADQVATEFDTVNMIFNNAGVTVVASAEAVTYQDFEWLMSIDFWGVVYGTKAFLPHLKASGEGHVINISSVFGLMSIPSQSTYNAAKFAVRGFTDALRIELEIERSCVSATTIHPGGIRTNIARNSRVDELEVPDREATVGDFDKLARTTPESAAKQILKAVERNRRRALIGPDAKVLDLVSRLPAAVPQKLLVYGGRRESKKSSG